MHGSRILPVRRLALALLAMGGSGLWTGVAAADVPYAMDDSFRASVQSLSQSLANGGAASALQAARGLAASADQPFEKYVAGQLMLQAAAAVGNLNAQRVALNLILDSGAAPAARAGELRALAGTLSAMLGDYKDAVTQIQYANRLGYSSITSQVALADAAFQTGDVPAGSAALEQAVALRAKGGQAVEVTWYDRAIALSYQRKRPELIDFWTRRKLAAYPSAENWRSGIVNLMDGAGTGAEQNLDLYRLMAATQALASERDWQAYSALAAQQGMFAEAKAVLDTAVANGAVSKSDAAIQKSLALLATKGRKALADIPALSAKAKSASGGSAALAAADAQLAAAQYSAAVDSYRMALKKGGIDEARANTRLGIALARSGDLAGSKAVLAMVTTGPWVPVAGLWSVWVDRQMVRNPA